MSDVSATERYGKQYGLNIPVLSRLFVICMQCMQLTNKVWRSVMVSVLASINVQLIDTGSGYYLDG